MNRYVEVGLLNDMAAGERVIYLGANMNVADNTFYECAARCADWSDVKIHRANGKKKIEHSSGGSILFRSYRSCLRGMSADRIFIDGDLVQHPNEWRDLELVAPNIERA